MTTESFSLPLGPHAAISVGVQPGATLVLRGSLLSRHDGSVVDAAKTFMAPPVAGATSAGQKGLVDFAAGGFELVAYDAETHEVELVAAGGPAPACELLGVSSPCLVLRSSELAHQRLLTVGEWSASLRGNIQVQYEAAGDSTMAQPVAVGAAVAWSEVALAALVGLVALVAAGWLLRRWLCSARRRLTRLIRRTGRAARRTNPVLAQVLMPALDSTASAVRQGRIDPASLAGRRLEVALRTVHGDLRAEAVRRRSSEQLRVADELLGQVELALEAAAEASG